MAIYSIKDLEKLTGIKAHTLRIWEQRYGIIKPKRTGTNIRYYTDEDLKVLLNIALLNKNGVKISRIAEMSAEDIAGRVAEIADISLESDAQLDALTISMIEMDEFKFEKILNAHIAQIGFERTMLEVINPFLEKLGILWLTGSINPAQEHFISALIRRKIMVAIDREGVTVDPHSPKFLLFLPEGESQELALHFMHYLLRARHFRVVYLGQNIPVEDLQVVYDIHKPTYAFTLLTETFQKEPVQVYLRKLSNVFRNGTILVSGYQVVNQQTGLPPNVSVLESLDETIAFLEGILKSS